jgi:hypothetical protein
MPQIILNVGITGCMGTNHNLFSPKRAPQMRESQQLFFGLRLVSRLFEENQQPAIQTKIEQPFGGFFSTNM